MSEIVKISVALTSTQIGRLKAAVAGGGYATISEVIREAIRDWQKLHTKGPNPKAKRRRRVVRKKRRKSKNKKKL